MLFSNFYQFLLFLDALIFAEFEVVANETHALILDTRNSDDFAKGFIPNSINIGLSGSFAQWVGEMIPGVTQEILLVTEEGKEEESMTRLSRVGFDHTIGYLKGGFDVWAKAGKDIETSERISTDEFAEQYKQGEALVIDIRKESEFVSEHVLDAVNIPLNRINDHLAEFPKDKPFILYCGSGYRTMIAASILKQRGWDNFTDVRGGIGEIKKTAVPRTDYVCPTTLL